MTAAIHVGCGLGLKEEGLYRVSPPLHELHELKASLDSDPESVSASEPRWDHNVFAAALKLFLRELPDPVIPYQLYDKFILATRKCMHVQVMCVCVCVLFMKMH